MDKEKWSENIWLQLDNQLSQSEEKDFFLTMEENLVLKEEYESSKLLHFQLENTKSPTPSQALAAQVMNKITSLEIQKEINADPLEITDRSLIPFIIAIFGGLILFSIVAALLLKGSANHSPVLNFSISSESLKLIGYLGILFTSILVLYRFSALQEEY